MNIAIFTQSLGRNFGGIMQNYALQKVLRDMGHKVQTVQLNPYDYKNYACPSPFVMFIRIIKRIICKILWKETFPLFYEYTGQVKRYMSHTLYTRQFMKNNLNLYFVRDDNLVVEKGLFDCLLVGSDQVWRPRYNGKQQSHMFFDFAECWNIKRVAYAASFGVGEWEYSKKRTKVNARLAKLFDAISVREDSGVRLCREYLGVNALMVLDPTLLLDKDDYIKLIRSHQPQNNEGDMACYILDRNPAKISIVETIAKERSLNTFTICLENYVGSLSTPLPSAETWLNMFYTSRFVFTDSFHGVVFSIIFNKPFVVYGNEDRGMDRFTSLLHLFGLEERLVFSIRDYDKIKDRPIDWQKVNRILKETRVESMQFLSSALQ